MVVVIRGVGPSVTVMLQNSIAGTRDSVHDEPHGGDRDQPAEVCSLCTTHLIAHLRQSAANNNQHKQTIRLGLMAHPEETNHNGAAGRVVSVYSGFQDPLWRLGDGVVRADIAQVR